ncbi:MAG: hypothetical protein HUK15_03465, partial [Bacteroidales bacterium]|nr:hypothetical protein [Bacteroidales bacterium]
MKRTFLLLCFCMGLLCANAQNKKVFAPSDVEPPLTRILFIFDASQSMSGKWEGTQKFGKARELLFELLDSLEDMQKNKRIEMALRVYGHQSPVPPQDCSDSKLEVSFG